MFCPSCGTEVADDSRFCSKCGFKFPTERPCPGCGTMVALDACFCSYCGTRLAAPDSAITTPTTAPGFPASQAAYPAQVQDVAEPESEIASQLPPQSYAPGTKVERNGQVYVADSDGLLTREENGQHYTDARSFFEQKIRNAQTAPQAGQYAAQPTAPQSQAQDPTPAQNVNYAATGTAVPAAEHAPESAFAHAPASAQQSSFRPYDYPQNDVDLSDFRTVDEDDASSDDDDDADGGGHLAYLSKKNRKKKRSKVDNEEETARKRFAKVNADGYYTDRMPIDYDEVDANVRRVQWIPLVLGLSAIAIAAFVLINIGSIF